MIVRRRQTEQFTVLANRVVNDDSISFEALGLLVYLLSRPHNWHVRLDVIRKQRGVGRDRIQRYMRELIQAGYAKRYKLRDPLSGTFRGDEYWIYDSPQSTDDDYDQAMQEDMFFERENPEPENRPLDVSPEPEKPSPGYPQPENRPTYKRINKQKTDRTKHTLGVGVDFDDFWEKWDPEDPADAFYPAQIEWEKLEPGDQKAAFEGVKPYLRDCQARQRKRCFGATFIRDRRWQGFKPGPKPGTTDYQMLIQPKTREWCAFRDHLCQKAGRKVALRLDEDAANRRPVKVQRSAIADADGWEFVPADSEAWKLWSLVYQKNSWPMPKPCEFRDAAASGAGWWFPSYDPVSEAQAAE